MTVINTVLLSVDTVLLVEVMVVLMNTSRGGKAAWFITSGMSVAQKQSKYKHSVAFLEIKTHRAQFYSDTHPGTTIPPHICG